MILITNKTNNSTVVAACNNAEDMMAKKGLYENGELYYAIRNTVDRFTYTDDSVPVVIKNMMMADKVINVYTYRPWWRRSKAIAYTKGKDIYLNKYKLNRSIASFVATICHESMHCVGYSHGSNTKTTKKLKSVPYWVGTISATVLEATHG